MKTKNDNQKTIHQRVEHTMRNPWLLLGVVSLMGVAMLKLDDHYNNVFRQAYAQGFGLIGAYMREETARMPVDFGTHRTTSISSF
jgi:hypothetical protein